MYIVTDAVCEEVFSRTDAFNAVESVFAAMASGEAYNFPVIREAIGYQDALYGFKSGFALSHGKKVYISDMFGIRLLFATPA